MKRMFPLLIIILLLILLSLSFFLIYEARIFVSRATSAGTDLSLENTYCFQSPVAALGNCEETIRIYCFALDTRGVGIAGRQFSLSSHGSLQITLDNPVTDAYGRSTFDVSSCTAGEYFLTVTVDGLELSQKAHLTFE